MTSHGALAFSATASTMAEKILPLVVDGCGPQRTHPAKFSDGRIPKKCLAERAGNRLAWRLAQFGGYAKHLVRGRFRIPIKWVEQASFGSVKNRLRNRLGDGSGAGL